MSAPRYTGTLHDAPPLRSRMEPERIITPPGVTLGEAVETENLLLDTLVQVGVEAWIYGCQRCVAPDLLRERKHHHLTLN